MPGDLVTQLLCQAWVALDTCFEFSNCAREPVDCGLYFQCFDIKCQPFVLVRFLFRVCHCRGGDVQRFRFRTQWRRPCRCKRRVQVSKYIGLGLRCVFPFRRAVAMATSRVQASLASQLHDVVEATPGRQHLHGHGLHTTIPSDAQAGASDVTHFGQQFRSESARVGLPHSQSRSCQRQLPGAIRRRRVSLGGVLCTQPIGHKLIRAVAVGCRVNPRVIRTNNTRAVEHSICPWCSCLVVRSVVVAGARALHGHDVPEWHHTLRVVLNKPDAALLDRTRQLHRNTSCVEHFQQHGRVPRSVSVAYEQHAAETQRRKVRLLVRPQPLRRNLKPVRIPAARAPPACVLQKPWARYHGNMAW
eukprot:m.520565 g.520565  ORF g.520565 m.520565 type:complete len:359 (+) comp21952_c0_seq3:493-1569(+)